MSAVRNEDLAIRYVSRRLRSNGDLTMAALGAPHCPPLASADILWEETETQDDDDEGDMSGITRCAITYRACDVEYKSRAHVTP